MNKETNKILSKYFFWLEKPKIEENKITENMSCGGCGGCGAGPYPGD